MNQRESRTRREFLRTCAFTAVAAGASRLCIASEEVEPSASRARSKVVIARDASLFGTSTTPDSARVQALVDQAMQHLTDSSDPVSPWKKLFRPDEVVGLKVNTIAGPALSTHPVLVAAISERLEQAGIPPSHIVVWDRSNEELERAGYRLNSDSSRIRFLGTDSRDFGYDESELTFGTVKTRLSKLLTRTCDSMINVPVLKHHSGAGITLAMKNMYGVNNNPNKLHAHNCCPAVADLNMLPPIRNKFRLVIADAIVGCFEGGPGFKPQYSWRYNGILAASDPVAIDYTGWQIIERERAVRGLKLLHESGAAPDYIAVAADPEHLLGTNDPNRIALSEV